MAVTGNAMAQELTSGYFTEDYKYRHVMNPAFGNEQNYVGIPILGNFNLRMQGSLGIGDMFFKNPDFGKPGAKKTATFMHPGIGVEEALSKFDKDRNNLIGDLDLTIASVGFHAFDGYNTVELKERVRFGVSLPYEFFEFAKGMNNKDYELDDLGIRALSYAELAFGHSRQITEDLRVGGKLKFLFGVARADLSMDHMHANLVGDKWVLQGKATAELNAKGAKWKTKESEYNARVDAKGNPLKYQNINDIDLDGAGLGGFGVGIDLGAVYDFKNIDIELLQPLKVSAAITDLGFISWSNSIIAENAGDKFEFNGFNGADIREGDGKTTFGDRLDEYKDDLADFTHLTEKGDAGSKTTALAATMRLGAEYTMPFYDKLTVGLVGTHRFDGRNYSWTEGRLSANCAPLKWVDGGVNLAVTTYCTTMGWIVNFHPSAVNVFIGMDHMIGKTGASSVPLDSNISFCFGMNVAWGKKK